MVVIHSLMNKVTGLLLFILPLTLSVIEFKYGVIIVCFFATFAAVQESYIISKNRKQFIWRCDDEKN